MGGRRGAGGGGGDSLRCALGDYVGSTHYPLRDGEKEVRYFLMETSDDARPQNEVDEVRWVTFDEARELLTYDYDRALLAHLTAEPPTVG